MNNSFFKSRIIVAAMGTLLALGASAQEKRELTYATFYGSNDFYETSSKYFMDEVTKRSDGKITFQPYYGGSLLKTAEMSTGISKGAADIGSGVPAAFNPREFPLSGVVLPFITENPYAATKAFAELYKENEDLQKEYSRNNQRLLWAIGSGENTVWTNKPIRTAEDLKGARIRAIIGVADAIMALGGTPISIPWVEALELVQRGGAEGVSGTPFNQSIVTKVFDMAPYGSNGGRMGVYTLVTWSINERTWNSFDDETKRIFNEVAESVPDHYFAEYEKEMDRTVKLAQEAKVQYVPIEEAEVQRWKQVAQPVVTDKWLGQAKRSVSDPAALLDRFTALVKKHEAERPYVTGFDRLTAVSQ
jgi:TRAP-type C4-dicarboxylate transport system substrate-binding protein